MVVLWVCYVSQVVQFRFGACVAFLRGFRDGELGQLRLAASYETLADCLPQGSNIFFSPEEYICFEDDWADIG